MGKYNHLKVLKQVKARVNHICSNCGSVINKDDFYFVEQLEDKFLHTINRGKFCSDCYYKFGNDLLRKGIPKKTSKTLTDF
jgi:transcription initiation factor IIF auxiliary subunit